MMKINIGIPKALKLFGGFVRYYDTTEDLSKLAALVSSGDHQNILACCGGGDQALTMLGASPRQGSLWAVDINPAQLFVLAAKASYLKKNDLMPSFEQLQKLHPGRVGAVKKNVRRLQEMYFYHTATGKKIAPPAAMAEKYKLITSNEMFVARRSMLFWKEDPLFIARVRARLGNLHFSQMDIFDTPEHFKQGSLDLIYLSDIFWPEALPYYQAKLTLMAGLLRPGGIIISCLDQGDDFMGRGVSPGLMLAGQAGRSALKIDKDHTDGGYLVLERVRRGR
jgi:hypothetical protein